MEESTSVMPEQARPSLRPPAHEQTSQSPAFPAHVRAQASASQPPSLAAARAELAAHVADATRLQVLLTRLTAAPDIPAMLREVLLAALELQGSDRGVVLLYDPASQDLSPSASVGLPDGVLRVIEHLS